MGLCTTRHVEKVHPTVTVGRVWVVNSQNTTSLHSTPLHQASNTIGTIGVVAQG